MATTKHSTTSTNPNFQMPPRWPKKHSLESHQIITEILKYVWLALSGAILWPSSAIILARADSIWKSKQRNYHYGGSYKYKSPDPSTYYTQIFGRTVCYANGSAGLAAIQALYESNDGPITASSLNDEQISYLLYITIYRGQIYFPFPKKVLMVQ